MDAIQRPALVPAGYRPAQLEHQEDLLGRFHSIRPAGHGQLFHTETRVVRPRRGSNGRPDGLWLVERCLLACYEPATCGIFSTATRVRAVPRLCGQPRAEQDWVRHVLSIADQVTSCPCRSPIPRLRVHGRSPLATWKFLQHHSGLCHGPWGFYFYSSTAVMVIWLPVSVKSFCTEMWSMFDTLRRCFGHSERQGKV